MKTKHKLKLIGFFVVLLGLIVSLYFIKDEKAHTIKKYYPESKETYVYNYIVRNSDTILHGKVIVYNKKGHKIAEGNLINNVPQGKFIYYYSNGKIESIKYVIDGKRNLEYFWYYPNEKIKKYAFFSRYEEPFFLISYDEKGPTKYEGSTIEKIYHGKLNSKKHDNITDNHHFKIGDTLIHQYLVANIPNTVRNLKIENLSIENSKVKRFLKKVNPCQLNVEEILTKKGKNTIRTIVKYEFKDKLIPVINDTLTFDVDVH